MPLQRGHMSKRDEVIKTRMMKIAQKKERLEIKEQMLKEKARKLKNQKCIRIGLMASNFGLDQFENTVLSGAFSEIQSRSRQSGILEQWRQIGEGLAKKEQEPLILSFEKSPTEELKNLLKERKFRWNRIRKEWQGYGIKQEIERLTEDFGGKVEVVSD